MELLAPVGYPDALKAAVLGGADAVYLAGKDFGARRLADNFSDEELRGAVRYAHDNKLRVYVTVNTLIKESELDSAASFVDFLHSAEVDALIVQDRGLMRYILDRGDMKVHASTQMGIESLDGALWAQEEGLERVILSRELSLAQINAIKEGSKIDLEVFIHGALCYCFSGGCLFSSMLGGRSGNRGLCAQPCRKKYVLGKDQGYLLSTADTFGVDSIPELLRIGVASLKIEGRMRSPQYVYLASKVYSEAIRRAEQGSKEIITPRERELLETVFNRGFSRGYLMDDTVMQTEYPDSRGLPLGKATSEGHRVKVWTDKLAPGDGITFYKGVNKVGGFEVKKVSGGKGVVQVESPFFLNPGDYVAYKTKDREFDVIQERISSVQLKGMRGRTQSIHLDRPRAQRNKSEAELSFYASSVSVMQAVLPHADRIYFELNRQWEEARQICTEAGVEFVTLLPRFSPEIPEVGEGAVMACTVGQMHHYQKNKVYTYYSLNRFNSLTGPKAYQHTLSVELSANDIDDVCSRTSDRLEVLSYGRVELMVSKDPCLIEGFLLDERGKRFQVYRDSHGLVHILNSSVTFLLDHLEEMEEMGVDSFGIDVRRHHPDLAKLVAEVYAGRDLNNKAALRKKCGAFTAAHFQDGVP
ncbi:MAG: Peptidase family U32 [Methanomassiliicoccales archaeon PtaU1.Bin124]|nr:MAG: Peptidase family U32 [Methanomassiliicoccales archaeon PtaU1.Bin124]